MAHRAGSASQTSSTSSGTTPKFGDIIRELRKGTAPSRALPRKSSELTSVLEHYFPRRLQDITSEDSGSHAQTRLTCRLCKAACGHRLENENAFSWHEAYFHIKMDCKELKKRAPEADIKLFLAAVCRFDKPDFFDHTIRASLRPVVKGPPSVNLNTNAYRDAMSEADFQDVRGWDRQRSRSGRADHQRPPKSERRDSDAMSIEHNFLAPSPSRFRHPSEAEALLQLSRSAFDDAPPASMLIIRDSGQHLADSPAFDVGFDCIASLYTGDPAYVSTGFTEEEDSAM